MVFKRYIKRHGKKLGPYYYENVRSKDGKVKSVYVGANPHQHPKHKIRKPLFFLILALILILILGGSLFLIQNKSYVASKVRHEEPDFEVDQILLKVLIRQSESIEKQLRVTNIGSGPSSLSIGVQGLSDLVNADSKAFTIKPGQTKVLRLNFSSFIAAENIEQQPGIYVGKLVVSSEKAAKEIPIIVEIETKNILFDMNLNPVAIERRVKQGTDTTIEVRLFNLESIESQNVDVEYFVKDMNGNTIVTESETVVAKTQASFFKTVSIPKNLKPGPYVFAGRSKFGSSVGTSSYLFEVVGPEQESFVQFCRNSVLCLGLSLSTMLLIIALMAYFYFFMGAYIYEKVTGIEILASRKEKTGKRMPEELEDEGPSFFERLKSRLRKKREINEGKEAGEKAKTGFAARIKNRLKWWLQERKKRKLEEENLEREKELESIIREKGEVKEIREDKQSGGLRKFHSILDGAYNALESEDLQKLDRLYSRARDLYDLLGSHEQQQAHGKLAELYDKRNEFVKKIEQAEKNRMAAQEKREKEKIRKAEKERLSRERREKIKGVLRRIGLYKTAEEKRQAALQKEIRRKENERKRLEELRIREQEERSRELERQKAEEGKRKAEEAGKKAKEAEERKREAEKQKAETELKRQREAEEKREQQEIRRKQLEEEKRNEEIKRQKELEKKQKEEEIKQKQIEEEKAEQEELKRKEEIRKQKEQELIRLEEQKRRKQEEEEKKKELERQNREKLRAEKLNAIKQLEAKLNENEEEQNKLKNRVENLENELKEHPKKIRELEDSIRNLDNQTSQKSQQYDKLGQKKASASEDLKKKTAELEKKEEEQKNARDVKIKELRQKLADRQASLTQEMEHELGKLSPAKRKATEKWKKLEVKAKLKIEEQNIKEEIAEYENKFKDEKARLETDSKSALSEISKSQRQIKGEIEDLSGQKEQALREKESISSGIENKKNKIQETKGMIHDMLISHDEIKSNLRKARSELGIFGFGLFSILPKKKKEEVQYREKESKGLSEEERLKEIEERLKAREEERKSKEEQKRLKREEKLRAEEERKRQKETEKELKKQEEAKKKESWLGKIFRKSPEEAAKAERQEAKETKLIEKALKEEIHEKPKAKEADFKPAKAKSRKLEKCYKTIDSARDLISRNKTGETKKLYLEARSLYLGLDYHEKKEVYDELMDLYNRLIK